MSLAPPCCGGCQCCRDCSQPPFMNAKFSGITDSGNCTNCGDVNDLEYKSFSWWDPHCDWVGGPKEIPPDCFYVNELAWGIGSNGGSCRLSLSVNIHDGSLQMDFWKDFAEPPDCWAEHELPLQEVRINQPSYQHCGIGGIQVKVWGSDK